MKKKIIPQATSRVSQFSNPILHFVASRNRKIWPMAVLIGLMAVGTRAADSDNSAAAGVSFLNAPEGSPKISILLAVVESSITRQSDYLSQRSPQPLEELAALPPEIAKSYSDKEHFAFQFAQLSDGTRYLVVLDRETGTKFLNRNESDLWHARIYRIGGGADAKPELLREGLQSFGNDVTFPVEFSLPGIGSNHLKTLRGAVGYSINGSMNGRPTVNAGRSPTVQVSGTHVTDQGKLTMTVTVPEEMTVTPEVQVTLQFEPFAPGLPERTASGKVTDFLTLGSARFAVTSLAPDFSSATLVIVAGSLEETLKQQLQTGAEMPAFSQVNLLNRQTVTREDLLNQAKNSAGIVFIFGDLQAPASQFGPGYPPMMHRAGSVLPLPASDIAEQTGVDLKPRPMVVLVTRQISLGFLYGEMRNKTPDYLVLTDFIDPLETSFLSAQSRSGWYGGPPVPVNRNQPSLRQLFNLPEQALSIVVFDRAGKVLYVKADAGNAFLPSLAEARAALKKSPDTE